MDFGFDNLIYWINSHVVTTIRYCTFTIAVSMTHKQLITLSRLTHQLLNCLERQLPEESSRSGSRSLLPATSRYAHSWHRAPLGPMAIYLFNVKTLVFCFFLSLIVLINKGGGGLFYIDWCSLTTPYSN
jgi:hypothetical protein